MIPTLSLGQFGRSILGSAAAGPSDPYFANVVTLVHFDDANGSQAPACVIGRTWTGINNAQVTTTGPIEGSGSGTLDGNEDYFNGANGTFFEFGSGDFTIEIAIELLSTIPSGQRYGLVSKYNSIASGNKCYEWLLFNNGGTYQWEFYYSTDGTTDTGGFQVNLGTSLSTGVVYRFAISRNGNNLRCFLNGTQCGATQTLSATLYASGGSDLAIGGVVGSSSILMFDAHMKVDELRLTKGVGRYTASYTPETRFPDA